MKVFSVDEDNGKPKSILPDIQEKKPRVKTPEFEDTLDEKDIDLIGIIGDNNSNSEVSDSES